MGERRVFLRHDRPARLLDPAAPAAESVRTVRALDLGHRLRNTIGVVRLVLGDDAYVVDAAHTVDQRSSAPAGSLVQLDADGARIATSDGDLVLSALSTLEGNAVDIVQVFTHHGIAPGARVPSPTPELVEAVTELEPKLARDEGFWLERVARTEPTVPPMSSGGTGSTRAAVELPAAADAATAVGAIAIWLSRLTSTSTVGFHLTDSRGRELIGRLGALGGTGPRRARRGRRGDVRRRRRPRQRRARPRRPPDATAA